MSLPRLLLTMGDVSGIGPEIVARVLADTSLLESCRLLVVGCPDTLRNALKLIGSDLPVSEVTSPKAGFPSAASAALCWNPTGQSLADVPRGVDHPRAGDAAYRFLVAATEATLAGDADGITTAPISKASLHLGGHHYPGHTEILAERCGVEKYAMMLYLRESPWLKGPHGLSIAHVTLHTSIKSVPGLLSTEGIRQKIELVHRFMQSVGCEQPRVAVCALNPHAGEGGLFGDEEARLIAPAVAQARESGIHATGPLPADTLIRRAVHGEFDGVAAMYHDQGHIAMKLIGFDRAVNVTLGLPIVRTSPSHGTAFDIAWQGHANADGLKEALATAALLAKHRQS